MPTIEMREDFLKHRAVILENWALRVVVLPELGGRIWSIRYKPLDRELLWHNPRIAPQKVPFGTSFDDVWCGGWEEMFPTAAPGIINGRSYPDHGELWNIAWEASSEYNADSVCLHLSCIAPISSIQVEKRISLRADEARMEVTYALRNPAPSDFPCLFALHPAFAVSPGCQIDFPCMSVELDRSWPGTLADVASPFAWPRAIRGGQEIDLRAVPPESSAEVYFLYGHGFKEGWCTITDRAKCLTWGLVFSPEFFRSCWLFATYGGWRNYYAVLLEPSTSFPYRIEEQIERGAVQHVAAAGALETTVVFLVQEGLAGVRGLTAAGRFRD